MHCVKAQTSTDWFMLQCAGDESGNQLRSIVLVQQAKKSLIHNPSLALQPLFSACFIMACAEHRKKYSHQSQFDSHMQDKAPRLCQARLKATMLLYMERAKWQRCKETNRIKAAQVFRITQRINLRVVPQNTKEQTLLMASISWVLNLKNWLPFLLMPTICSAQQEKQQPWALHFSVNKITVHASTLISGPKIKTNTDAQQN
eukprot:scaffold22385_cov19-Tisochrysis_lutea.AAC.5